MSDGGQERQGEGRGGGRGWQVLLALEHMMFWSVISRSSINCRCNEQKTCCQPASSACSSHAACASLPEFNRQHSSGVHLDGSSSTMCSVTASTTDAGFHGMKSGTVSDM